MTKVLRVDASMRAAGSITRAMVDQVIAKLEARGPVSVTRRDLKDGVPFVNEAWIGANFTDANLRSANLIETDFRRADLSAVNLENVLFDAETRWLHAKGLYIA